MVFRITVARKVCFTSYDVTFDERGVLAFYDKAEELLTNSGFSPLVTEILMCFWNGLKKIFPLDSKYSKRTNKRRV